MRDPTVPSEPPPYYLGTAMAVVVLTLIAAVIVGVAAGWRTLAALPPVLVALALLVTAVRGW